MKDFKQSLSDDSRVVRRVLRNVDAFTADRAAEVAARFDTFLLKLGKPLAWAAQAMGEPEAAVAKAVAAAAGGLCGKEHEAVIRAIDKFTDQRGRAVGRGFIKTRVAEQVFVACQYAIQTGKIALVTGPAGCGKTTAARAAAMEMPGSIFISLNSAGSPALGILNPLAEALRIPRVGMNARAGGLFESVSKALEETGRGVFVDEIQKIASRQKDVGLHILRDLHDATGCGMVWVGMPTIATYIQAGHAQGLDTLDQIYSRVALWLDVSEACGLDDDGPKLSTEEDIIKMIASRQLRLTGGAVRYLAMLAREHGAGAYRAVAALLDFAERFARGAEITEETLRSVQAARLGLKAAERLESSMGLRMAKAVGA